VSKNALSLEADAAAASLIASIACSRYPAGFVMADRLGHPKKQVAGKHTPCREVPGINKI
jgi:hypothetical protein